MKFWRQGDPKLPENSHRDVRVFSKPEHFGSSGRMAIGIIDELQIIYRRKHELVMSRFSRGSILVAHDKVLTNEMIDRHFDPCSARSG